MRVLFEGKRRYLAPIGNTDFIQAVEAIEEWENESFLMTSVPKEAFDKLLSCYGERLIFENRRDYADYLYLASDFYEFSGKKLHGQRNHFNNFKDKHENYKFCEINTENTAEIISFLKNEYIETDDEMAKFDHFAVLSLLNDMKNIPCVAGYIEDGGEILGFSIGKVVNDTLVISVEKGKRGEKGIYQALSSEFAKKYTDKNVIYINREEDLGREGMRISKKSYHPIRLLEKFDVEILP